MKWAVWIGVLLVLLYPVHGRTAPGDRIFHEDFETGLAGVWTRSHQRDVGTGEQAVASGRPSAC